MAYCQKCNRTLKDTEFYTCKNGDKTRFCKKCLTMHVDPYNPDTFLWILEEMDFPWLPWEWDPLLARAASRGAQYATGSAIFGKYLGKLRLGQYAKMHWADSKAEQEKRDNEFQKYIKEHNVEDVTKEKLQEQYLNGEITEAQYKTLMPVEKPKPVAPPPPPQEEIPISAYDENSFLDDLESPAAQLTQEDKIYLAMKWGRNYHADQWVKLEKSYNDMCNSFDVQDADTKKNLMLLCKTWLKMDEAIDIGDVDTYQKLNRVAESQRKTAKFTAAQNKDENKDEIDCIGKLVAYCEKEGHKIPRFDISVPRDIVDRDIADMKEYTRSLIYEDKALAQQIETYLKKREILDAQTREELLKRAGIKGDDEITDEDYFEHFSNIEASIESDLAIQEEGEGPTENISEEEDTDGIGRFDDSLRRV